LQIISRNKTSLLKCNFVNSTILSTRLINGYTKIFFLLLFLSNIVYPFSQSKIDSSHVSFNEQDCLTVLDSLDGQFIYDFPDVEAEYPDGIQKLILSVIDKFTVLDETEELQFKYRLTFIVDSSGAVRNACVVPRNSEKKSNQELELERIFQSIPDWKPALVDGKKVYSRIDMTLNFDWR
jgi:hypothetical protein